MSVRYALLAGAAVALAGCAPLRGPGHAAHHPSAAPERVAGMDAHMKAMREMHEKMARARTPEERQALMAEHSKLMQDGMGMMGGMGGMGGADPAARQQMMEKRMDMMQSMMQMMMDRMQPPPSAAPK